MKQNAVFGFIVTKPGMTLARIRIPINQARRTTPPTAMAIGPAEPETNP
jgi:hypothetical protein